MSGGALFGNNATRSGSKNLVEFKAGRMTMKGKMVYPDNRKGLLYVYQSDDSLMHFCWKDRTSGAIEDDLIIFPDDCEFKHVPQCKTGRVYLLRFKSSNRKFFFWLQDLKTDKDEEHCRKINEVLNNPPTPGSSRSANNPEGDLQNLLNNMSQQQLMQLFGGVGGVSGLGSLLGTINRSHTNSRNTTSNSSTSVTTSSSRPSVTQTPISTSVASSQDTGNNKTPSSRPATTTATSAPSVPALSSSSTSTSSNRIQLSDLQNFLSGIAIPSSTEPAAVQSGQAGPMVRQFGLGADAVSAAATGNIEQFVTALETETKEGKDRPAQEESQAPAQPPSGPPADKKDDDDDEGMALD